MPFVMSGRPEAETQRTQMRPMDMGSPEETRLKRRPRQRSELAGAKASGEFVSVEAKDCTGLLLSSSPDMPPSSRAAGQRSEEDAAAEAPRAAAEVKGEEAAVSGSGRGQPSRPRIPPRFGGWGRPKGAELAAGTA
mmetsp:Transcript_108357/g.312177  ORF Transcript_108357/g.312177 Transcript_108357/m.312177 type:complete len:136 (+) Transcript_108357:403-810(+)